MTRDFGCRLCRNQSAPVQCLVVMSSGVHSKHKCSTVFGRKTPSATNTSHAHSVLRLRYVPCPPNTRQVRRTLCLWHPRHGMSAFRSSDSLAGLRKKSAPNVVMRCPVAPCSGFNVLAALQQNGVHIVGGFGKWYNLVESVPTTAAWCSCTSAW